MAKFAERRKKWGEEMVFRSISLPENIIGKLKLLKGLYQEQYKRQVSYGEIFERLFSSLALGNVDPGVYAAFEGAVKSRSEIDEVVTRSTRRTASDDKNREKEARCIEIVKAASPALPTDSNWVKGEWFVNEESGLFFPVLKGKYGKTDYATVNRQVFNRYQVSENDLLSPDGGFIRVKVED